MAAQAKPNPVGRPSKYPKAKKDREAMLAMVIECGNKGYSECQIAVAIGAQRSTMQSWADYNHRNCIPEFAACLARAKESAQAWWEEQARSRCFDNETSINSQVFKFVLASRYRQDYAEHPNAFQAQQGASTPRVQINYNRRANTRVDHTRGLTACSGGRSS
jgi:hypothetical protein